MIKISNKSPLVLTHESSDYLNLIELLNEATLNSIPVPFEFYNSENYKTQNYLRKIYPSKVLSSNQNIKLELIKFAKNIELFLKEIKLSLQFENYNLQNNLKYILRVRLFQDEEGFNLAPHKDSPDTVMSFICQLDKTNELTSIYKLKENYTIKKIGVDVTETLLNKIINKLYPKINLIFTTSQFTKSLGAYSECGKFFELKINKDDYCLNEYVEEKLKISYGSIYGIHNTQKNLFQSDQYEENNEKYYHGVYPINSKKRKILILDLLAAKANSEVLIIEGVGKDLYSYYVLFSSEKNILFNSILK